MDTKLFEGAANSEPQEWDGKGCCIRLPDGAIICIKDGVVASSLRKYHNAALADIVSAAQMANTLNGAHIKQLKLQLAAEQERRKQAEQDHQDFRTYWLKLAEAHGCNSVTDAFVQLKQERSKVLQLESFGEQLADCQSSRKPLVEALEVSNSCLLKAERELEHTEILKTDAARLDCLQRHEQPDYVGRIKDLRLIADTFLARERSDASVMP